MHLIYMLGAQYIVITLRYQASGSGWIRVDQGGIRCTLLLAGVPVLARWGGGFGRSIQWYPGLHVRELLVWYNFDSFKRDSV
jgi:hypothetical protein